MKRKFLEDLGLEKDVIDKIMTEHGTTVEKTKGDYSKIEEEKKSLEEQLTKANETIEGFKDYDEVKGQVTKYKDELENYKKEQEANNLKTGIKSQIEAYAKEKGAKDIELIHSLANYDSLIESKNQNEDIKKYVDGLAESKAYLFGAGEPFSNPVAPTTKEQGSLLGKDGIMFNFAGVRPKPKQ